MTCQEARALAPLHLSGELLAPEQDALRQHLASCRDCEREIEEQANLDAQIAAAVSGVRYDPARVQALVLQRISAARVKRIWQIWAAAAAVIACVVIGFAVQYGRPIPRFYWDAARDHWTEIVQRQPRHWVTGPREAGGLLLEYGVTATEMQGLAAKGLAVERVKTCGVDGRRTLHLVLTDGKREYSLYLQPKQQQRSGLTMMRVAGEQLGAFKTPLFDAVVVSTAPPQECRTAAQLIYQGLLP